MNRKLIYYMYYRYIKYLCDNYIHEPSESKKDKKSFVLLQRERKKDRKGEKEKKI